LQGLFIFYNLIKMTTIPETQVSFSDLRSAIEKQPTDPLSFSEMYNFTDGTPTTGALTISVFRGKTKVQPGLFPFTSFTFSGANYASNTNYTSQPWYPDYFSLYTTGITNNTDQYQLWTIPKTGQYRMNVGGGGGGNGGGAGSHMQATFTLTQGDQLIIITGDAGVKVSIMGTGGGMSAVLLNKSGVLTTLVVGGGGGGRTTGPNASFVVDLPPTASAAGATGIGGCAGAGLFQNSDIARSFYNGLNTVTFGGGGGARQPSGVEKYYSGGGGGWRGGAMGTSTNTNGVAGTSYVNNAYVGYVSHSRIGESSQANGFVTITAL
jgi:hypothetical protein